MIIFHSVNEMQDQIDEVPKWPEWAPCMQRVWAGDGRQESVSQLDGVIYMVAVQYQPDMQNGRREVRVYSSTGSGFLLRRQGETPDMHWLGTDIMNRLPSYVTEWVL